ncbi:MAG TPA: aldo/keto reductase [Jatrophihabitans sp.]
MTDEVLTAVQGLKPLADQAGLSMAQLAVAWVLQNPNVSAAIVGASRPEQVHDNAKASGVKLDADLLKAIDQVIDPIAERDPAKTVSPAQRPCGSGLSGRIRSDRPPVAAPLHRFSGQLQNRISSKPTWDRMRGTPMTSATQ